MIPFITADADFITLALRTFGGDPSATAEFDLLFTSGVTIHMHAAGHKVKLVAVPSTDNGVLTIDVQHVIADGLPVPASWAEKLASAFVTLPGLSYAGGVFRLALPFPVRSARVWQGRIEVAL